MAIKRLFSLTFFLLALLGAARAASVSGWVWQDQNTNGIQDPGEPGLPYIWVSVLDAADTSVTIAAVQTDPNGLYDFPVLPAGTYRLKFSNPGGLWQSGLNIGMDDAIDNDANVWGFTDAFTLSGNQALDFDAGFTTTPSGCFTPVEISISNVVCHDNGTPNDPTDDTFSFDLTATGGTGPWGWDLPPSIMMVPYGQAYTFGPFPISGGSVTITINDHDNPFCTATVSVDPPPCSPNPSPTLDFDCSPPVLVNVVAGVNSSVVNYLPATATTTCPDGATTVTLVQGLPSGSEFPLGTTQVCYQAADNCGNVANCCFTVTVAAPPPCDVKVIGCIKYELLSITKDSEQNRTYRIRVTNNCNNKLIYTAFQVPDGVTALAPANGSVYTAPSGREYDVRNPNFSPFYSVRFKSVGDSISNGESDIFQYTLPAQSDPLFIHVIVRLSPKIFYEAHLNTFDCVQTQELLTQSPEQAFGNAAVSDGLSVSAEELDREGTFAVFPNPASRLLYADLSAWNGQNVVLNLLNAQGQRVGQFIRQAGDAPEALELGVLPAGLYYLQALPGDGKMQTRTFVVGQ
ncbi:MAG: HYR domain-containing protein [Saprospiraceae bacterium]|nr:HYR domain-containing protein [Saprospiraceae bacterium]